MKVRLVGSKGEEIDVPVELEKVVAEYRAEAEANCDLTTKMERLVEEMEEIRGLERGKIGMGLSKAGFGATGLHEAMWGVTLMFYDQR